MEKRATGPRRRQRREPQRGGVYTAGGDRSRPRPGAGVPADGRTRRGPEDRTNGLRTRALLGLLLRPPDARRPTPGPRRSHASLQEGGARRRTARKCFCHRRPGGSMGRSPEGRGALRFPGGSSTRAVQHPAPHRGRAWRYPRGVASQRGRARGPRPVRPRHRARRPGEVSEQSAVFRRPAVNWTGTQPGRAQPRAEKTPTCRDRRSAEAGQSRPSGRRRFGGSVRPFAGGK